MRPALLLALAPLLWACTRSPRFPGPPEGEHPDPVSRWLEVTTVPPPVEVEEVSPRPSPRHLWIDGQWAYQPITGRWVWEQGRWCVPPPGAAYYARARVARERQQVLQDGKPLRVTRWNEMLKQHERVDVERDGYRWIKGGFYGPGADGKVLPVTTPPECAASGS